MVEKMRKEAYWAALVAIAGEHLEINSFEQTGQKLMDIRLLRVADIANARTQTGRTSRSTFGAPSRVCDCFASPCRRSRAHGRWNSEAAISLVSV
jgi:hypothetical protein